MKKRYFIIPTILSVVALASCNSVDTTTNTSKTNDDSTTSNNSSSTTTTNSSISLNATSSNGLAPITTLNSIDTSILTIDSTDSLYQVDADSTLSGNYTNGVEITTAKKGTINLTLDNATIYQNQQNGKALYNTNKNVTVNIYLKEGTTSYIYNNFDDSNALHIKGTLNIEGSGKLVVISGSKSAIKCSGKVNISNSNLYLEANSYGINCETFESSNASIEVGYASKDGIRSEVENEEVETQPSFDDSIGYVKLRNTTYKAIVEGDGIQANTYLYIDGGNIDISTQGTWVSYIDKDTYELSDDDFKWSKSGNTYKKIDSDTIGNNYSHYLALAQSSKGLKVGALKYTLSSDTTTELEVATTEYSLTITNNALVNLTTSDSGIKVDYGDVLINEGSNVSINAGNKGVSAEHDFTIEGEDTSLIVTNSYEAVEATHCYFKGGSAILSANDDGINAASDYTTSDYSNLVIEIDAGLVSVNSNADGLDSNGTIYFNGGTTYVLGPTTGADEAIDADSKIYFNGGFVLAFGSSGMANTNNYTTNNNTYAFSLINNTSSSQTITIKDSNSNVLVSVNVSKSFGQLVFSSSSLTNSTYTIELGSTSKTLTLVQYITSSGNSNGGMNPGNNNNNRPGGRR